jgi:hypothetical protein
VVGWGEEEWPETPIPRTKVFRQNFCQWGYKHTTTLGG